MYKYKGMPKAKVLVGSVVNREEKQVKKLEDMLHNLMGSPVEKMDQSQVYKVVEKIKVVKSRNASYKILCEEI